MCPKLAAYPETAGDEHRDRDTAHPSGYADRALGERRLSPLDGLDRGPRSG